MKTEILHYLQSDPRFRERINKNKGICNLLAEKYHIEIPKDKRDDFIADILSADRCWRQILSEPENEYLRGSDYNDKLILSQEKQLSLGYEPRYHENKAILQKL